jgi:hypothetical protein
MVVQVQEQKTQAKIDLILYCNTTTNKTQNTTNHNTTIKCTKQNTYKMKQSQAKDDGSSKTQHSKHNSNKDSKAKSNR